MYYTLCAQIPTFATLLDRSILDENLDAVWSLLSRMTSQANSAKNDDFGDICNEMASWTKSAKDSKTQADRGYNKKEYAASSYAASSRAQFDLDWEAFSEDVVQSAIFLSEKLFPSLMYDLGSFDPFRNHRYRSNYTGYTIRPSRSGLMTACQPTVLAPITQFFTTLSPCPPP